MKRHQKDNELAHYVKSFNLSTRLTHFKSIHSKQTDSLSLSLSLYIYIYIYIHTPSPLHIHSFCIHGFKQPGMENTGENKFQKVSESKAWIFYALPVFMLHYEPIHYLCFCLKGNIWYLFFFKCLLEIILTLSKL